jgi:hypothetical protein
MGRKENGVRNITLKKVSGIGERGEGKGSHKANQSLIPLLK